MHDWNTRTPEGLRLAVDEFTQAIVRAPDYAEAYAGLADCYNLLREYTPMPPGEAYPRAKAAALRAIALDDSLPGGHRALAFEQFYWEWHADVAEREFRRALALEPTSATTHHWYGNFLLHQRRFDAALHELDEAEALDPLDSAILSDRGLVLNAAGRQEEALSLLHQMEQTNPDYQSPHRYLADIDFQRGDLGDYLAELTAVARLLQDPMREEIARAAESGWRSGGREGLLKAMLAVQVRDVAQGRLSPYEVARTYARMGDGPNALHYLQMAKAAHDTAFLAAPVDTALAGLNTTPSFRQLASL
jgi:tetratricopeptide (TPR) repeat protein